MSHLEFSNLSHKQSYSEMMREWRSFETPTSPWRLLLGGDFEEFLEIIQGDTCLDNGWVNSHLFFLVESVKILWAIQIRHHINHPNLIETGGHIGYGIRPSKRGKWHATQMLALALEEAKKIGLEKVLITCYDTNISSRRVIEKNGGIFERYTEKDGQKMRRYWITLTE